MDPTTDRPPACPDCDDTGMYEKTFPTGVTAEFFCYCPAGEDRFMDEWGLKTLELVAA